MTGSTGNRAIARSTATSYLRLAVTAAVQFAMVPLLLGHLGPEGYGQYALMLSVIGFLALLELGAGAGAVRAAAAGAITGPAERNRMLSAQLAIGLATGVLGASILLAVAPHFGRWFGLPVEVHDEVTKDGSFAAAGRWAALLAMAGLAFLPFHAGDAESALRELALRALAVVALALMLDGPLEPVSS